MLLIIHNLPNKMRYSDVKALIRDRCGLTDLILDNLTYVHPDSYKVTVGLTDENDAAIIFNNLNGLDCLGQKLFVEDLRKKKQSSKSLDYTGGIQMQQKEQGNNIRGVQKSISRTQPMPTKSFYGPMNTYSSPLNLQSIQASAYQYLAGVSQEPNSMAMNTQTPASYDTGVGGKYGASSTTIILNTNTPSYNVSPSFGNDGDQQGLYNSNDSQSNFISYSAKKPFYQSYNVNQDSSRYFQKKNDEPHTSDNRQSLDMHTRDTSDCSKRMPSIRNERETLESHNRSNTLIGRRFDDWNRSDNFSKHSDSFISYPIDINNKSRGNYSDRNERQVGDVFSRHSDNRNSYPSDRNNKSRGNYSDRNQRQVGDVFSRYSDNRNSYPSDRNNKHRDNYGDRNQRQVSNYKEGVGGNVVGNYSQHSNSAYTGGDFNRPNNLNPSETDNNSFFNQSNLRGKNKFAQSYKAGFRGIASDHGFGTRNVEINKKQNQQQFPYRRGNDFKESRKAMNAQPPQYPKNKEAPEAPNTDLMSKNKDISAPIPKELKRKHENSLGQASSAIAKRLLMKYGKTRFFVVTPKFINYLKPYIKTRINEILGKRVAVHFEQIIDEYNQRYPLNTQQAFLIDIKKQYQGKGQHGHVSGGVVKASGSATVVNKGIKRAANDDIGNLNPAKISKKQSELDPSNVPLKQPLSTSERLPKYPGGDKKEHNKLKRMMKFGQVDIGDVFKMDPQLKKVRDDEIDALCNLFLDECKKPATQHEAKVCKRIMNGVEALRNELRLGITKRVLNITQNIPLRIYTNQKIKSVEIDNHLKKLGIVSLRKARGRKLYIGMCTSFDTHDKLCDMARMEIGSVTLLFRPMNSGGKFKKVKGNMENDGNKKGAGDFDQDNTDDIEDFGDEDIGYDEDDYDEEHSDDNDVIELQSDENNDVEIIDDKPAVICVDDDKTNAENKNTDGAKNEISQTKDETSKSEKISVINVINNSDKSNDNKIQKSETENLLKDIQTLADCISNEENVNGVNVNIDNNSTKKLNDNPIAVDVEETKANYEDLDIDVTNITQDDLEDF